MTQRKSLFPQPRRPNRRSSAEGGRHVAHAVMSLGVLAVALSACEQEVLLAKPSAGDYEVVALVAD